MYYIIASQENISAGYNVNNSAVVIRGYVLLYIVTVVVCIIL